MIISLLEYTARRVGIVPVPGRTSLSLFFSAVHENQNQNVNTNQNQNQNANQNQNQNANQNQNLMETAASSSFAQRLGERSLGRHCH
jgi:hypothetical protein